MILRHRIYYDYIFLDTEKENSLLKINIYVNRPITNKWHNEYTKDKKTIRYY